MKSRTAIAAATLVAASFAVHAATGAPEAPSASPHAGPATGASPHGSSAPAVAKPVGKIEKSKAADGKTVAEVVAGRAALKGKSVTIHGQVVKANMNIMGKNWIHLQDGSGTAAAKNNDIVVTTQDGAAVGDVVNASGTVRTDVDLGSGYAYAVLVEDAKLRK